MSYFFGTPVTVVDNQQIGNYRKNKMGDKILSNKHELEPVHGSKHRHKRSSVRSSAAVDGKTSGIVNGNGNRHEGKVQSPSRRHRKHRNRDVEASADAKNTKPENRTEDVAGITEEIIEKNVLLLKAKNKYGKLEKIYRDAKSERERLSALVEKRDCEYRQLHIHHEELTRFLRSLEAEKGNALSTNKRLTEENIQLNEDVGLLKIVIYRLNVELERYQDKLRMVKRDEICDNTGSGTGDVDVTLENKRINDAWGRVNVHALGPLLEAYQENLAEKDELIEQYGIEMNNFSGRCKQVVAENEVLRTQLEDIKSQYDKCNEEIKTITQDAAIVKEQNDLLTKQISLQKLKLQEVHDLYEKKVDSMSRDNNKLHADYLACNTELSNLRGKYEILSDGYEKLKTNTDKTMPVFVHTSSIEECKRLFEELKCQYDSENKKLTDQVKRLEQSNPDNERQLVIATTERDQLKKQTKNLEKNLKRTQYELDRVRKNVCSIEISKESLKRQMHKTTVYCEELVAEQKRLLSEREKLMALVTEREKENENIQYLGNNIAHRMGNLKSQLHSVQKGAREQLKSVEKHIKIQERDVGQMKTDYNRELQRLKELVKQKEDVIGKLQREKYATQDNLELVWRAATSDDKKVKDALKNTKIYNI